MNNLTISEFKINLGYSQMFGERDTPEEALKFCNEMLDSSPHKLHIDHITAFMVYINTLITHLEKQDGCISVDEKPEDQWINTHLPHAGIKVLAHYVNGAGKSRIIIATYITKYLVETNYDYGERNDEYNETDDTYYLKEGWYECIDNWEEYTSIVIHEGEVDKWQYLPKE